MDTLQQPTILIEPHGGLLTPTATPIDALPEKQEQLLRQAHSLTDAIVVDTMAEDDIYMMSVGGYSPLVGFMDHRAQKSVIEHMQLPNGILWPIPITLPITREMFQRFKVGQFLRLENSQKEVLGVVEVQQLYQRTLSEELYGIFGTADKKHPGVQYLENRGPYCLAGPVTVLSQHKKVSGDLPVWTPLAMRQIFKEKRWQRIVGFQTRNPIHRAHEYLIKCALEGMDGALIHPLVGCTKADDVAVATRVRCYQILLQKYFVAKHTLLSGLWAPMRYAGPREAVLHAIIRQNFGCSHFIVGRDHAGVGQYYDPYAAQELLLQLSPSKLKIVPILFDNAFFCRLCAQMATQKTCNHEANHHVSLSGTQLRQMLQNKKRPPPEYTRPEVADILMQNLTQ